MPGGFNGPVTDDDLATPHAALGATLPGEFVDSLRMHNGLAEPDAAFADGEALLSARARSSRIGRSGNASLPAAISMA
ncbi:SMI1/KNR4 family protein [Burkholderia sp. ABCPW 14]|uniref:SMI1/KNR4 family protein n=1 Tax=Burkholderia sp. ABCPW 14 TaxID=1637860 RepID=UPI000A506866|nr:SMI1/KNR4 family protein [Burkholderia sp. ABCPW 14]